MNARMNTAELRLAVNGLGWSLLQRKKWNQLYFYAARRLETRRIEKYLFPASSLSQKTQADVWEKLL